MSKSYDEMTYPERWERLVQMINSNRSPDGQSGQAQNTTLTKGLQTQRRRYAGSNLGLLRN